MKFLFLEFWIVIKNIYSFLFVLVFLPPLYLFSWDVFSLFHFPPSYGAVAEICVRERGIRVGEVPGARIRPACMRGPKHMHARWLNIAEGTPTNIQHVHVYICIYTHICYI